MWLEAIITQDDLAQVIGRFLPVKIYLPHEGQETKRDRWLLLHPATAVALVPEEGLQVTCPADLTWAIAGMSPEMRIDELRVMLRPRVVAKETGSVLEFHMEIEEADFHRLPGFIDAGIVKTINGSLATKKLAWDFTKALTRTVGLGRMFDPVEALTIKVLWGKHRIGAEALTLVASFKIDFERGD